MKQNGAFFVPTYSTVVDLGFTPLADVRVIQDVLLVVSNGRVALD